MAKVFAAPPGMSALHIVAGSKTACGIEIRQTWAWWKSRHTKRQVCKACTAAVARVREAIAS